jgi:putative two-component system response regulator
LPEENVELMRHVAPLHDLGKVGIPDALLLKPVALSAEEFEAMKQHTIIGGRILADGRSELIRQAEQLALTHHEWWDGSGYPCGLRGEAIPLISRIVSVVDVFDALTHSRPYKAAWPHERALAEIARQSGTQFDPDVARVFLEQIADRLRSPSWGQRS